LIDTLDALVVFGNVTEFQRALKLVIRDVSFDRNLVVSTFETNIRVLGGLLAAHALVLDLRQRKQYKAQFADYKYVWQL
jgi:mannosidase alpha-like ER degradation enhancer 3